MTAIENAIETGATVILDEKYFVNCRFTKCTLVYMGGEYGWIDTQFVDCKIALQGSADRTAGFLKHFGWSPPASLIPTDPSARSGET